MRRELSRPNDLKAFMARVEDLLERVRVELRRDVVERIFYLENEVISLRRELKRLSEVIDAFSSEIHGSLTRVLIERGLGEKPADVHLRLGPEVQVDTVKREEGRGQGVKIKRVRRREVGIKSVKVAKEDVLKYLSAEANDTELKILKLLYENPEYGERGSTEIAKVIGKVREHTARTLKKLCEMGLLVRQEDRIPYSYYLPKEVAEAIKSYFGVR